MNAVDTNILVYSVDDREPVKQAKARQCLASLALAPSSTVLLWQVLIEFIGQLRRWRISGILSTADYLRHIQTHRLAFPLAVPNASLIDRAIRLEQSLGLSHWDSLILAACEEAGVSTLYTEDMGSPTKIASVDLVNPLM